MITYGPILTTGEVYHVFNQGIDHTTFINKREFKRALITLKHYQYQTLNETRAVISPLFLEEPWLA
jgi:hypothetical protein